MRRPDEVARQVFCLSGFLVLLQTALFFYLFNFKRTASRMQAVLRFLLE